MTEILVPTRDGLAGIADADVTVNGRLHAFNFFALTLESEDVATPELTSSAQGPGTEVNGPGQTFIVPCEVLTFCIPRGPKC